MILFLIPILLLLLAIADMPSGYYVFMRIVVCVACCIVAYNAYNDKNSINVGVIIFGLMAVLFNPIIPIYFYDKDMLLSAESLLVAIIEEMEVSGSRGGAAFIEDGKIKEENKDLRKCLTVSDNTGIYFEEVNKIPLYNEPFEKYLKNI